MKSDVIISKLTNQDIDKFIELVNVFEEVFEMKNFKIPERTHLQKTLEIDAGNEIDFILGLLKM